jgi:hypothetical protein
MRLPVHHDLSTVVTQPSYDSALVSDIIDYIPEFCKRLKQPSTGNIYYHYTTKNGPNGPALQYSDTDFAAVQLDTNLYNALCTVSSKLNDDKLPKDVDLVNKSTKVIHSRISQFPEKSGKTRTIAVVDYYSQRALKPLHDKLMSILRALPSDGTFSHNSIGLFAKNATLNKFEVHTSDATAFTDRFPAVIQYELLKVLIDDQDLVEAWWTLLAKRSFHVPWTGETVQYSTGQPMGAYASWALCTLAHHLIVHYSASKTNVKGANKLYRIIGDDIVITNKVIASFYKETFIQLGMELNQYKSTSSPSGAQYSGAEVAKKLFLNGLELSPLTPGLVKSIVNPYLLNSSILEIQNRFNDPALPIRICNAIYGNNQNSIAWVLTTNPFDGSIKPGIPGYDSKNHKWGGYAPHLIADNQDLKEELFETAFELRYNNLMQKVMQVNSDPKGKEGFWVRLQSEPQNLNPYKGTSDSGEDHTPVAVIQCAKHLKQRLNESMSSIMLAANDYSFEDFDEAIKLREVEYIPDPTCPFTDIKELRKTQTSLLIIDVYNTLL